ncbi:hypothetical protein KIPB_005633 [Kipferlia bialata]|uniref:Uncharacterized protein n=1 Tax=Kipferlia bialata TaxID=797122 RepID=A0A9K3GGD2_9EUKA|nr:hypothetical protein KIPB_002584 [Kipferlia bialata]GIQ84186.1 hypothetical protein KIPB_005633 [Kipferlia bialata]|eukprot:g2584.t1
MAESKGTSSASKQSTGTLPNLLRDKRVSVCSSSWHIVFRFRSMRRMDAAVALNPNTDAMPEHHVVSSEMTQWVDFHIGVGRYVIVPVQGRTKGTPLVMEAKCCMPLEMTPLPPGAAAVCQASTAGAAPWTCDTNPQYSFTVDEPTQKVCVELLFTGTEEYGTPGFGLVKADSHERIGEFPEHTLLAGGSYGESRGTWDLEQGIYIICPWRKEGAEDSLIITVGVREATLQTQIYGLG